MFERLDEAATDVLSGSKHECIRLHLPQVMPEHVLLALTRDTDNIAAQALASMNINSNNVQPELEKLATGAKEPAPSAPQSSTTNDAIGYADIAFSPAVKLLLERAAQIRRFFGKQLISPEHILLAIVDRKDENAMRILDELGANITFLRRQVLRLIAACDSASTTAPSVVTAVVGGTSDLIRHYMDGVECLTRLADATDLPAPKLPSRTDVVLMIFLAFLPDFLFTQVAYQRYLLEETLKLVARRTGPLDKETVATMVSAAAQNLRADVRSIIETLWTQEYRVLNQMPDEAEQEEIGSIIEDLWWTYSEEIALHEVFDEALDDYRRKHVLNLQKGKLEISQRLNKLRLRLGDTMKQCFLKRSMSA